MKYSSLTSKEAQKQLTKYGFNILSEANKIKVLDILVRQFKGNFVIILLAVGAFVSLLVGENITFYVIFVVIGLVIILGFIQEYKAEKSITALKQMLMPQTIVIRDGKEKEIDSSTLVPDDIVVLRTGEKAPADCLILDLTDLQVDEAVLTGESMPVSKKKAKNSHSRKTENKIFMGTHIVNGKCVAQVLHTGMNTEFGKIAGMIDSAEKEIPLQKKVNEIAKKMSIVAFILACLIGLISIARAETLNQEFLIKTLILIIAISVSAFPEGFPMVMISTLASGATRMAKKNAIVNRMSIIETLGEVTTICTDKTGTLTKGEMTAKKVYFDDKLFSISGTGFNTEGIFLNKKKKIEINRYPCLTLLNKAAVACNDASISRSGEGEDQDIIGTPTKAALLVMSAKADLYKDDLNFERLSEIPFNSQRKMMSVLVKHQDQNYIFAKGAPEILLEHCNKMLIGTKLSPLNKNKLSHIIKSNKNLNAKGYRTLALAYKMPQDKKKSNFEQDLIFLGIVALEDPPRDEAKRTIKECQSAGIKIKMITGDNRETAIKIAKEIGFNTLVMTGDEIEEMGDEELRQAIKKVNVFARVKPEHKLRLVRAFKENGEIVAMTGDGVNDAPAIKEAHVGIAMGKNGTDVSRETADLVLKDDNFATIVEAIKEGRTIFSNIQKFVTYQLSCNVAELLVMFLAIVIGLPVPFVALQILFMNLVTDNMPAITLGFNPPSLDVMEVKARKNSSILNKELVLQLLIASMTMTIGTLAVFYLSAFVYKEEIMVARTTALVTMVFFQIFNAFNFRSFRYPMKHLPLITNKYLIIASFCSLASIVIVISTPLKHIMEVETIPLNNWLLALFVSTSIVTIMDMVKRINRHKIAVATNRKKALNI